jgi:antitoxin ParD1/3/4
MRAYRTRIKIKVPKQLVLSNLPFRTGQVVEVLVLAQDEEREAAVQELKALFKETQSLPQVRSLSDEDILAEMEAYRSGA